MIFYCCAAISNKNIDVIKVTLALEFAYADFPRDAIRLEASFPRYMWWNFYSKFLYFHIFGKILKNLSFLYVSY
jgi:hypothetical protein